MDRPSLHDDQTPRPVAKPMRTGLLPVLSLLVLLPLTGCEGIALIAQGFSPPKVEALYRPVDRPTLVLVDDPPGQFGDPSLPNEIAHQIGFHLIQQAALTQPNVVSPHGLYELATRLGEAFATTPIDQIGQRLGAEQVVYVYVQAVRLIQEPGMFRPSAAVRVRVIDTTTGTQLFPDPQRDDVSADPHYHNLTISMFYRSASNYNHETVRTVQQLLAKRIARDVARLFFDHTPRQPGEKFDD